MRIFVFALLTTSILSPAGHADTPSTRPPAPTIAATAADACFDLSREPMQTPAWNATIAQVQERVGAFGVRIAVTIGNSFQQNATDLNQRDARVSNLHPLNAARDADLVAQRFRALGYDALCLQNADYEQLRSIATILHEHAGESDMGIFVLYMAGHGFSLDGRSYVVGNDADPNSFHNIFSKSWNATQMLDLMAGNGNRQRALLLDTCRSNLSSTFSSDAHIGTFPPESSDSTLSLSVFADYAASENGVAFDWPRNLHGLFAQKLGDQLGFAKGGESYTRLLGDVNDEVRNFPQTSEEQATIDGPPGVKPGFHAPNLIGAENISVANDLDKLVEATLDYIATDDTNCAWDQDYEVPLRAYDSAWLSHGQTVGDLTGRVEAHHSACVQMRAQPDTLQRTSIPPPIVAVTQLDGAIAERTRKPVAFFGPALLNPGERFGIRETANKTMAAVQADAPAVEQKVLGKSFGAKLVPATIGQDPKFYAVTNRQIRIVFNSTTDTELTDSAKAQIAALVTSAPLGIPGAASPRYLIVYPTSGQGPKISLDAFRKGLIRLLRIEAALTHNLGVRIGQVVEPNFNLPPAMRFSDLGENEVAMIRVDAQDDASRAIPDGKPNLKNFKSILQKLSHQ